MDDRLQRRRIVSPYVWRSSTMKVTIENNELVIRIAMQEPRPSASGKTLVVATSSGNKTTEATVNGKPITIGLNAYITR